jgi:hypothetical protein
MRDVVRRATERGEFRPAPSRRGKWKAAVRWATSNFCRAIPNLEWASQFLDHHAVLVRSKPGTADQLAAAARATSSRLLCTSTLSKITVR